VAEGALVPLITVATIPEHEDVLMRPESLAATGLTADETANFLDDFVAHAEHVIVWRRVRPSIQDPSDETFVKALINGVGEAIVTFNRRDYLDADRHRASQAKTAVPVMSPGEALRRLAWRPTTTTPFGFPRR
jgi:predicted nucleic acid-binding protein